jgi:hypothetical protein
MLRMAVMTAIGLMLHVAVMTAIGLMLRVAVMTAIGLMLRVAVMTAIGLMMIREGRALPKAQHTARHNQGLKTGFVSGCGTASVQHDDILL